MSRQCPVCHLAIDPTPSCDAYQNGICQRLDEPLRSHIECLTTFRAASLPHLEIKNSYDSLPESMQHTHFEWRIRAEDVRNVKRLLQGWSSGHVLEIGAWNGWLSHHLVKSGQRVTALGYAADNANLGAKHFHSVDWHAIQMDLTQLDQLQDRFDKVILNHGLHLFPQPVDYLRHAMKLVKPGGLLIALCLIFFRDPSARIQQIKDAEDTMQRAYGLPYFLRPTRGYMDMGDRQHIQALGLHLQGYQTTWKANAKARLIKTAPTYQYGSMEINR